MNAVDQLKAVRAAQQGIVDLARVLHLFTREQRAVTFDLLRGAVAHLDLIDPDKTLAPRVTVAPSGAFVTTFDNDPDRAPIISTPTPVASAETVDALRKGLN